jgi:hypothetical protein
MLLLGLGRFGSAGCCCRSKKMCGGTFLLRLGPTTSVNHSAAGRGYVYA